VQKYGYKRKYVKKQHDTFVDIYHIFDIYIYIMIYMYNIIDIFV